MIELKNVSSGYEGREVLKDIILSFPLGQVTVLMGPNGCGKSTLLKTALGILPKTAGRILYDNTDISKLKAGEIAKKAAYLTQTRNVPHITAGRVVLHGRFPYLSYPRRYRREDYEIVREVLRRTDSLELIDCQMEELSGGQQQKVYLAMALAQDTETIFMDEPTTYLDVRHQLEVMEIAKSLAAEAKAVVLVLHDLSLAMKTADKAVIMSEGRVIMAGRPDEVYESSVLEEVFGVSVRRAETENGWQYYCEPERRC